MDKIKKRFLDFEIYEKAEVDTISGSLSAEIDFDIITFSGTIDHDTILNTHDLTTDIDHDQLTNYTINEHRIINDSSTGATDLWSAQKISDEITSASGTTNHNALDNLDYASSGHTGFASTADLTTTSGSLQTQIDGKDNYQSWSFAVDGVTKDAITSSDVLDFVGGDNITITRSADDQITISGAAGGGVSDHGSLTGLEDDDHPQYILTDGTRGFSATVSGVDPIQDYHLTTKSYIDTVSGSLQTNIDGKSDIGHIHDDRYYTETESDAAHDSLQSQINNLGGEWLIKSADYVASVGNKIMLDSSAGPFTITLPGSPSLGDSVGFLDMAGNCGTNNVTITISGIGGCEEYTTPSGNAVDFDPDGGYTPPTASGADFTFCINGDGDGGAGDKIMGLDEIFIIDIDSSAFDLIYSTFAYGWRIK